MAPSPPPATTAFIAPERAYLRGKFDQFFSTLPTAAKGFQIRTWRTGLRQGEPKLSPAAQSLVDRGLMRLDIALRPPRLFFTEPGLAALCTMMADRRLANPARFGHIRQELGIDPLPHDDGTAD